MELRDPPLSRSGAAPRARSGDPASRSGSAQRPPPSPPRAVPAGAHHGHEVQQVHARHVGPGVGQPPQRGQAKPGGAARVAALGQNTRSRRPRGREGGVVGAGGGRSPRSGGSPRSGRDAEPRAAPRTAPPLRGAGGERGGDATLRPNRSRSRTLRGVGEDLDGGAERAESRGELLLQHHQLQTLRVAAGEGWGWCSERGGPPDPSCSPPGSHLGTSSSSSMKSSGSGSCWGQPEKARSRDTCGRGRGSGQSEGAAGGSPTPRLTSTAPGSSRDSSSSSSAPYGAPTPSSMSRTICRTGLGQRVSTSQEARTPPGAAIPPQGMGPPRRTDILEGIEPPRRAPVLGYGPVR